MEQTPTTPPAGPAAVVEIDEATGTNAAAKPRLARSALTKAALVQKRLQRAKGASLAEIGAETSWQPHSCRAFISGLRRKGAVVADGTLVYRIAANGQKATAA